MASRILLKQRRRIVFAQRPREKSSITYMPTPGKNKEIQSSAPQIMGSHTPTTKH
ncbi:MAG: hypothetical protein ACTTJY_03690 [Hoylesella shahii]|uniref:hypothetical protein n=1 Tax=Hoylesella shahii TaxID=228603 RepID=UPI003F9FE5E6